MHLHPYRIMITVLAAGCFIAADAISSPETDLAAPGAPLYEKAVTESVVTLKSKQEQAALDAQGRPPSPGPDYYWCQNCKAYHKRTSPASAGQPRADASVTIPPSPGPDSYWCEKCKAYHQKQTAPHQHDAATPNAAPGADARPPSPGKDYSWCKKCKTYHLMKPAAPQKDAAPAAPHAHAAPPAAGSEAAEVQSGEYYYCESCKTYHRKPSALQQPMGSSPALGSSTNSFHRNSFTNPPAIEH